MEKLSEFLVFCWTVLSIVLFVCGWLNYPLLILALGHRVAQLRDRQFHLCPTTPTHAALFGLCALIYGLLLPIWYFGSIRLRHSFEIWEVGPYANSRLTLLVGVVCTLWLAGKLAAALREGRALYFGGRTDRFFAAAGFLVFAWVECWLLVHLPAAYFNFPRSGAPKFLVFMVSVLFPAPLFLGAMFVYGAAWIEAGRNAAAVPRRRTPRRAVMAAALLVIFAPYWLSLPRVGRRAALRLIEERRDAIVDVAERADLDPRLLAGIIYVNQTRDRPLLTGDFLERLGLQCNKNNRITREPAYDRAVGLCGVRPTAFIALYEAMSMQSLPAMAPGSKTPRPISFPEWIAQRPMIRELKLNVDSRRSGSSYYVRMASKDSMFDPIENITLAATQLHVLRNQWRATGYSIDDRPEILATLYNLGFRLSAPKASPRPNDFGRRVKAFMESAECARLFPPPKKAGTP